MDLQQVIFHVFGEKLNPVTLVCLRA